MIESIQFKNFKALRDATLPLSRFTLIVGPNGSGKSTALQAIQAITKPGLFDFRRILTLGQEKYPKTFVEITLTLGPPYTNSTYSIRWHNSGVAPPSFAGILSNAEEEERKQFLDKLRLARVYSLNPESIANSVLLIPDYELSPDGSYLAGILDQLRDQDEKRFEELNSALSNWLPEFDRVTFETPKQGHRAFLLRTRNGHYRIPASDLSQGTLLALALLTLAYLPDPPSLVCLEEPDRGIHPRLLREVQDALYRLSYPESAGEQREPVQVIATTHSPYFLNLFRDHPEEVVIANKTDEGTKFERLSDQPYLDEVLGDSHLGEIWYTGILGGVPVHS